MLLQLKELVKSIIPLDVPKQMSKKQQTSNSPLSMVSLQQLNQREILQMIILGRRATGKSSLIKDLLKGHLHKCPEACALVFHGNEKLRPFYSIDELPCNDRCVIYDEYQPDILTSFVESKSHLNENNIMVVFDNCFFDVNKSKCGNISSLGISGINTIFSADHPFSVPAFIRKNCSHLVIFREQVYMNRKRICDMFSLVSIFGTAEVFHNMYNKATTDVPYGYLLIDLETKTCHIGRSLPKREEALSIDRCENVQIHGAT